MTKRIFLYFILSIFIVTTVIAAEYEVRSPNNTLIIKLKIDNGTTYEVWHGQTQLINASKIGLNLSSGIIVGAGTVKTTLTKSVNNQLEVKIGKNKTLTDAYNELIVEFNENYKLIVRAYNEGLAYRFVTDLGAEIIINTEDAVFNFTATPIVYFPECDNYSSNETGDNNVQYSIHQGYRNFERVYNTYAAPIAISDKFSVTPVLFEVTDTPYKIVVTEADNYDYPGMYIERTVGGGIRSVRGKWAQYPKAVMDPNNYYSNHLVYQRENYIVKTNGTRVFPWRVIIATDNDKSLLNNELVYLLAEPSRIVDDSWIVPGKSAWEWWHKAMLEGVSFPVGNKNLSVQLYKYYIDWASENGLEYMTLDAGYQDGWLYELCNYAKQKNVKIIAWTWASNVSGSSNDWIKKMKAYGVAGAKIDFFERNDQLAMRWGYEFAQRLADSKMVAIFHGCPVPAGLNRTYPNILNFEAVRGGEDNFWRSIVTPNYHTLIPFIRSIAGPEDYTPGSMRNKTAAEFFPVDRDNTVPSSMGTRSHELSMYVVFDHWLGYLCDSPTEYNKYPDIKNFLSKVPTVWDKTLPLDAQLGKYISIAKQKGADWYVGGMSNWDARSITVKFDFLSPNISYQAEIFKDALESSTEPKKYLYSTAKVSSTDQMTFNMAKGGGFVIHLKAPIVNAVGEHLSSINTKVSLDYSSTTIKFFSENQLKLISIYDMLGKNVLNQKCHSNLESINISTLKKGVYLVKIQDFKNVSFVKFSY